MQVPPQPAAALASVGGRPPVPANNVTTTALSASASHAAIAPTYTASSSPPLSAAPAGTRRHPIHPALASPPNSPPRLQEGGSPYMTNGLASPPRMTYSKPSALEPGWLADQAVATNGHRPSEQQDRKASSASSPSSGPRSGRQALGRSLGRWHQLNWVLQDLTQFHFPRTTPMRSSHLRRL